MTDFATVAWKPRPLWWLKTFWQCRGNLIVGLWFDRILVRNGWRVWITKELFIPVVTRGNNALRMNLWIDGGKPVRSKYAHLWHERKVEDNG